ncbi:ribonuclease H-like domain-containing protein, partial [Tanacetum coccineum]
MDVKSAFLYGKIEKEVYVCQPLGFEDLDFPDRVYKVEKALYGLRQAPRAWYETLSTYLLDIEFQRGKIDKTLFIKRTVKQEYEPTTAEEKQDKRNEMKARATLLMALPNMDQLKLYSYQDAKLLMEAIEKSLPSEWKTHALIWRNKVEIKTIGLDDLHNNLKIYESKLTGSASTIQNPQNVAFVSNTTNNTNITNKADNTAYEVSTAHTQGNSVNSTSLDNLCDAVICDFLASQPNSPQLAQEDLEQL